MKYTLLVLLSAVLLGACGAKTTSTTPSPTPVSSNTSTFLSLKELLASQESQKCTYAYTGEDGDISGEILVSKNKFKQNSQITMEQETVELNAIYDGQYVYTWNSKMGNSGLKFKLDDSQTPADGNNSSVDLDKKIDYKCTPVTVSDKDFQLPSDIQFFTF